jgi:hypothetical protein
VEAAEGAETQEMAVAEISAPPSIMKLLSWNCRGLGNPEGNSRPLSTDEGEEAHHFVSYGDKM